MERPSQDEPQSSDESIHAVAAQFAGFNSACAEFAVAIGHFQNAYDDIASSMATLSNHCQQLSQSSPMVPPMPAVDPAPKKKKRVQWMPLPPEPPDPSEIETIQDGVEPAMPSESEIPGMVASPRGSEKEATSAYKNRKSLSIESLSQFLEKVDQENTRVSENSQRPVRMTRVSSGHLRSIWCEGDSDTIDELAQQLSIHVIQRASAVVSGLTRQDSLHSNLSALSDGGSIEFVDRNRERRCPVFHPGGVSRLAWNGGCLALIIWDILMIPMAAFGSFDSGFFVGVEWFCTVFWTGDMIFNFRTGYFIGSQLEMRPNRIAYNYATTWLALDVIIVIMEWVGRFTAVAAPASLLRTSRILRTVRFIKLMRLAKMQTLWYHVSEQINSNFFHLVFSMSVMTLLLMICVHLVTCAWYALGDSRSDGWPTYDAYEGEKGVPFWYLASQRWVIAQLNGRTDMDDRRNMIERGFTCLAGITMSVMAKSMFTALITKTLLELSQLASESTRRRRFVNEYLENHHLSTILTMSVKRYLQDYQDPEKERKNEQQVLAILPQHVRWDLLTEVRAPRLTKHCLFGAMRAATPRTMRRICTTAIQVISPIQNEVVFDVDDSCSRMLFVDRGTFSYGEPAEASNTSRMLFVEQGTTADGQSAEASNVGEGDESTTIEWITKVVLEPGKWLCEPSLWTEWLNRGRLVSDHYTCLFEMRAVDLAKALKEDRGEYARAVLYARRFVQELTKQPDLSDIISFEITAALPFEASHRFVRVTIVSAAGLRNADRGFLRMGKSDPYCVCEVSTESNPTKTARFQTKVIDDCLDPCWDHSDMVPFYEDASFRFEVFDKDYAKKDDSLGSATLDAAEFLDKGVLNRDLKLVGFKATGTLKVIIQVLNK